MNNNNKELMSQDELHDIMYNYLKPELNKCKEMGGVWADSSNAGGFYWNLGIGVGYRARISSSRLCINHWKIYNNTHKEENVNIKIFNDHVEFIEDSKFTDFDRDFMYGLYFKIKEYVEGCNNEDTNTPVEKDPGNNEINTDDLPIVPRCDYDDYKKKLDDAMTVINTLKEYGPKFGLLNKPISCDDNIGIIDMLNKMSSFINDDMCKILHPFCSMNDLIKKDYENKKELIFKETLKGIISNSISSDIEYCIGSYYEIDQHNSFGWIFVDRQGDVECKFGCEMIDNHWEVYHRTKRTKRVFVKIYSDHTEYIKHKNNRDQSIETTMTTICEDVRNYINIPSSWRYELT